MKTVSRAIAPLTTGSGNVIGLDLDGTLLKPRRGINYGDPNQLSGLLPEEDVVSQALRASASGWDLIVITGRTAKVRCVTDHHVSRLLGDDVPVVMQDDWNGVQAMVQYKAQALVDTGARLYVGDSRFDEQAAARAGCLYRRPKIFGAHGVPAPDPHAKTVAPVAITVVAPFLKEAYS